jgi:hypothetical protein
LQCGHFGRAAGWMLLEGRSAFSRRWSVVRKELQ